MKSKKFIAMVLAVAAAFSLCIPTMAASDLEPQKAMEVKDFYGDASDFNTSLADYTEDNRIMSDISAEPYIVDETIVNNDIKVDMAAITAITSDDASYVMTGESGTTLLVDSISSQDYRNLTEWGNQSFGFTHLSNKNIYLAFTDMGIWRISPENLSAEKLTSDTYLGDTRAAVASEFADIDPDAYLVWVDSVFISPDGNAVIYRTNRDSIVMDETSIWKIDLNTGEESQMVSPAYNNDIVGFITGSDAVIGALEDTQMVDIVNATSVPLDIPDVPNCCVNSVKDGKIIFSYRGDDSSNTTACISNVDTMTGKVFEITEVSGYLNTLLTMVCYLQHPQPEV